MSRNKITVVGAGHVGATTAQPRIARNSEAYVDPSGIERGSLVALLQDFFARVGRRIRENANFLPHRIALFRESYARVVELEITENLDCIQSSAYSHLAGEIRAQNRRPRYRKVVEQQVQIDARSRIAFE